MLLIYLIFLLSGCMSLSYERHLNDFHYTKQFNNIIVYRGIYIDKNGYYKQKPVDYEINVLTELSRAFKHVLRSTNLFKKAIIMESGNDVYEGDDISYFLIIKTDYVSFKPEKNGYAMMIRVYILMYRDAMCREEPFYFRVYASKACGKPFSHLTGVFYEAVDKILNRLMENLSEGDFDNPAYESILMEEIHL
jgi:hypothetical protein